MAIVTEYYMTRSDGVVLNRTYSDAFLMIERDGVRYAEAVDPAELNREYTETDEPVFTNELQQYTAFINELYAEVAANE